MTTKFLKRQLDENVATSQHVFRGHINITPIFQAQGKKVSDFTKSRRFKEAVTNFNKSIVDTKAPQLKNILPVIIRASGRQDAKGTWIHPRFCGQVMGLMPAWTPGKQKDSVMNYAGEWMTGKLKPLEDVDLFTRKPVSSVEVTPADTEPAVDQTSAREMARLRGELESAKRLVQELMQKANAYDSIMKCGGWFSLRNMAKIIGVKDMGPNNLRKWMTANEIVFLEAQRVVPYQEYVNRGWMKAFVRQFTVEKHQQIKNYPVTRYTMKGVIGIFNMLKNAKAIPHDTVLNLSAAFQDDGDEIPE